MLRTPDERFDDLPGYPFEPSYVDVQTAGLPPLRMHYVDAGPRDAPVVLLLHGQPTWSYLYRSVIAGLAAAGLRVIAPDNVGFGRSDKPADPTEYTFARHVDWMHSLVTGLDLSRVTLVAQDWGGPIGFSVAGPLSTDVLAAYDAPFPDRAYKSGLRQMIALIPLTRNDPGAAIGRTAMAALGRWEKPFLSAYSDGDPATRGWETVFQEHIPGARGQNHTTIAGAGHFVPEQKGDELARLVAEFVAGTS